MFVIIILMVDQFHYIRLLTFLTSATMSQEPGHLPDEIPRVSAEVTELVMASQRTSYVSWPSTLVCAHSVQDGWRRLAPDVRGRQTGDFAQRREALRPSFSIGTNGADSAVPPDHLRHERRRLAPTAHRNPAGRYSSLRASF